MIRKGRGVNMPAGLNPGEIRSFLRFHTLLPGADLLQHLMSQIPIRELGFQLSSSIPQTPHGRAPTVEDPLAPPAA